MLQLGSESVVPEKLTGRDLETLVMERISLYQAENVASIDRTGVQAIMRPMKDAMGRRIPNRFEPQLVRSKPDFEGCWIGGRFISFDCKVCSEASFSWADYRETTRGERARQLSHMLGKSRFGAYCFFLIHWNLRVGKTFRVEPVTVRLMVDHRDDYWQRVQAGEERSIKREVCIEKGSVVPWDKSDRGRKYRPSFLDDAIELDL